MIYSDNDVSVEIQNKINEYLKYLNDTDWYYARKLETNEEVPVDVVAKRIEARELIRANEVTDVK